MNHEQLKSYIERIQRLEQEKANLAEDINEVYKEVASAGFDKKIVKQVIKLLKLNPDQRAEQEHLLELYMEAVK